MYNSYLNNDYYFTQFKEPVDDIVKTVEPLDDTTNYIENKPIDTKNNNSIFGNLMGNFKMPEFTTETLILLAIVYFSLYDEIDTDLIIIVAILFFIGL